MNIGIRIVFLFSAAYLCLLEYLMINLAFSPTVTNCTGFHSATPAAKIVVQLNMKRANVTAKYQYANTDMNGW
jgi:hypothetical protein